MLSGSRAAQDQPGADALCALALELAGIPENIRGFGHVKLRHIAAAQQKWHGLLARWRSLASAL